SEEGAGATLDAPYGVVLAPVDLSEHSAASARAAARVARAEGARLILATVVPRAEVLGPDPSGEISGLAERLTALNHANAERHLAALERELAADGAPDTRRVVVE